MDWILIAAGVILIVLGLVDIAFTVLYYEGYGFLSLRVYRGFWSLLRFLSTPFPDRVRGFIRTLGVPLMVPLTLLLWLGLELFGFSLFFSAHMDLLTFRFDSLSPEGPGYLDALYLSGVTLATLGYGDIVPTTGLLRVVCFLEGLIGFSIITLSITYVLNINQTLQSLSRMAVNLYHQSQDTGNYLFILRPYFRSDKAEDMTALFQELNRNLLTFNEGLRHYPILYYYYSRDRFVSLPYGLRLTGEVIATLRWSLPAGHPVSGQPWLLTLISAYSTLIREVNREFQKAPFPEPVDPPPFEQAASIFRGERQPEDPWLRKFIEMERWVRIYLPEDPGSDDRERYQRFVSWYAFSHRASWFVNRLSRDLGYPLQEYYRSLDREYRQRDPLTDAPPRP